MVNVPVKKGSIDYVEFRNLVAMLGFDSHKVTPEDYYASIVALVERVELYERDVAAMEDTTADVFVADYERDVAAAADYEGSTRIPDEPTSNWDGFGDFLKAIPEDKVKYKNEYETQEGAGWPPQDS
jgi:hypothetical protein